MLPVRTCIKSNLAPHTPHLHIRLTRKKFHRHLQFPLGSFTTDGRTRTINKPEAQEILHAVEELYFFRRYAEAVALLKKVWEDAGESLFDRDTTGLLRLYETRCGERLRVNGQ